MPELFPVIDDILLPINAPKRQDDKWRTGVGVQQALSTRSITTRLVSALHIETAYGHGFLFIPVYLIIGAVVWFSLSTSPPIEAMLIGLFLCAGAAAYLRYRRGYGAFVSKSASIILAGMALAHFETARIDTVMLDTPVTTRITGTVERREIDARGYWRYIVNLSQTTDPVLSRPPQKVTVLSRSRHQDIPVGATLTGRARLSPPSGPALPGLNDFAFSSYFDGIGATGFFYGPPTLLEPQVRTDVASNQGWLSTVDAWLYDLRSHIANRIRSVIGGDAGAFAASIVTDERRAISETTMEALRVSGLAHIVAISGLNMALASGIFFVGLRMALSLFPGFAQRWPVKKIAAFAALIMTLAYYLISGFAVSAERAWLMMSIMLIAVLLDRPSISLRNVAISAIIIVAFSPSEVMGPSFQMSFSATVALVSAYALWSRREGVRERMQIRKPPWWFTAARMLGLFCAGIIVTSLIGGISTAIYSIEHFHRVTTYGLAANLLAMPVMSFVVMPFALFGMLLMPLGLDAPFLTIMGYGMSLVIEISTYIASWGGDAGVGRQHGWFMGVATLGFIVLTLFRTRLALLGLPLLLTAGLLLFWARHQTIPDVLIYEDGQLVALVATDVVSTTRSRPSDFIYAQWQRALLLPQTHQGPLMLPETPMTVVSPSTESGSPAQATPARRLRMTDTDIRQAEEQMRITLSGPVGRFTCQRDSWCIARSRKGSVVAVITDSALTGTACNIADIVVTARRVGFESCRSGAVLLSVDTLRRTGSLELTLAKGEDGPINAIYAAMAGKRRPWTIHRSYDWRRRSFDPEMPQHVQNLLVTEQ